MIHIGRIVQSFPFPLNEQWEVYQDGGVVVVLDSVGKEDKYACLQDLLDSIVEDYEFVSD